MRVVSAYTVGTPYEQVVKTLRESCKKHVPFHYHLIPMACRGTWARNCQIKPDAIIAAMADYVDDVLWVDADAEFLANPLDIRIELEKKDFGCHFLPRSIPELLSGTLYFNTSTRSKRLLNEWKRACEQDDGKTWDQKILQQLVKDLPGLSIAKLHAKWCWVDSVSDMMVKSGLLEPTKPIIYHHQASRKHRF